MQDPSYAGERVIGRSYWRKWQAQSVNYLSLWGRVAGWSPQNGSGLVES